MAKLSPHEDEGGGGGEVTAVVNDQLLVPVIALPAVSLTAVVMAAVKVVEPASDDDGLNVAVFPSELSDTAPCILVVPCFSVKDELVTVELCTGSLNVAVTEEVNETPVASSGGLVLATIGGVVSAGGGEESEDLPSTSISDICPMLLDEPE